MGSFFTASQATLAVNLTLVEVGLLFIGLGLLSWLALKLHVSSIPLFLIAGLALGKGGIVPLNVSEDFLNVGAEIGAILLLLVLGFEYSASELAASMKKRWHAGLMDIMLNAVPAAILALILGYGPVGALAFAGIMFISSSGIASQLIRESGWGKSNVAKRVTSVLVFEDILMAPYLPILAAVTLGLSVWAGLISVTVALGVTMSIFLIAIGREIPGLKSLANRGPGVLLLLVFGVTLAAAGAATLAGFSGAIAAFLIGMLLTGEVAESLRSRFAPLREIFSAIFFLFFGLSISVMDVVSVLPVAIAFSILGIAGKLGVGWWVGRDMTDKMSWRRIGAFLVARGEFSMIIAATVVASTAFAGLKEITLGVVVLTTIFSTLAIRFLRSPLER
jgi:CPA2 family monovalent cation:H+ antiporter-2